MAITKSISSSDGENGGIANAIAAIRTLRQEFEHNIEKLTADCDVLMRAEGLIVDYQVRASKASGPRNNNERNTLAVDRKVGFCDSDSPTGLRKAICRLAVNLPERFTAPEVLSKLQAQGFKFAGAPKAAVRDGLYALTHGTEQRFRIAEPGKGGKPNIYERL